MVTIINKSELQALMKRDIRQETEAMLRHVRALRRVTWQAWQAAHERAPAAVVDALALACGRLVDECGVPLAGAVRLRTLHDLPGSAGWPPGERAPAPPPPSGFRIPPAPTDLRGVKRWIKAAHDAFTRRELTAAELNEVRRTAASMFEGSKAQADVRRSIAALEAAQAQNRMAEGLAGAERGGTALPRR